MSLQNKKLNIGLFGFGVVGEALYHVLNQTPSLHAEIKKVCIKHPEKKRNAPTELFTTDASALLQNDQINVIVELIDDSEAACSIAAAAIKNKKAVVSANKKMIAENLEELLQLQEEYQTPLLYESACCASIPVIRNLEEYYDNDLLAGVRGIVNGSTNYILTRIHQERLSFQGALKQAQELGFAESDPTLDIHGTDAVNKLCLLLTHAYGIVTKPQQLIYSGIQQLNPGDSNYAQEKNLQIKLIARAEKLKDGTVAAFVLPQFIPVTDQLYHVKNEYNGVIIKSGLADEQFFYGKGAGGFPTASAVLSDLSALRYDYKYEYKKLRDQQAQKLSEHFYLRVYVSFPTLAQVPHELFEYIEEWNSSESGCYVTGVLHISKLNNSWWKKKGVSLILLPEGILEESKARNVKPAAYQELVV